MSVVSDSTDNMNKWSFTAVSSFFAALKRWEWLLWLGFYSSIWFVDSLVDIFMDGCIIPDDWSLIQLINQWWRLLTALTIYIYIHRSCRGNLYEVWREHFSGSNTFEEVLKFHQLISPHTRYGGCERIIEVYFRGSMAAAGYPTGELIEPDDDPTV